MLTSLLIGHSIVRGALRSDNLGYIAFAKDELASQGFEHSFFLVFHNGAWLWPTMDDHTQWATSSVTIVKNPREQALYLDLGSRGEIYRVGSGDVLEELALFELPEGPKDFGPMCCIRSIDGDAYAVGMGRQVYRRRDVNRRERMDFGVRTKLEMNNTYSFEAVHGFSHSNIYAAGRRGEIWRFDGRSWAQQTSPTDQIITDICCTSSGTVVACGLGGTLLSSDNGVDWIDSEQETTREDFWSIVDFKGRTFLATTSALYEQIAEALVQVDFGEDFPATCLSLSTSENVLWSIGPKDIFSFDGSRWSRVDRVDPLGPREPRHEC